MTFVGLLIFAAKCFNNLAWPLCSLGYPLCASVRAIELNSSNDIQKLVTYWVSFSLILRFDHAFATLLYWNPLWPYMKLLAICWLVIPNFDGSLYVYKHVVHTCVSETPVSMINWVGVWMATFLVAAEKHIKGNGAKASEKLIADKGMVRHWPIIPKQEVWTLAIIYSCGYFKIHGLWPPSLKKSPRVIDTQINRKLMFELLWVLEKNQNLRNKVLQNWHKYPPKKKLPENEFLLTQVQNHYVDQSSLKLVDYIRATLLLYEDLNLINCMNKIEIKSGEYYKASKLLTAMEKFTDGPASVVCKPNNSNIKCLSEFRFYYKLDLLGGFKRVGRRPETRYKGCSDHSELILVQ